MVGLVAADLVEELLYVVVVLAVGWRAHSRPDAV